MIKTLEQLNKERKERRKNRRSKVRAPTSEFSSIRPLRIVFRWPKGHIKKFQKYLDSLGEQERKEHEKL